MPTRMAAQGVSKAHSGLGVEMDHGQSLTSMADDFLCGIIEGFYGQPWQPEQRLDLFRRLRALGLNAYIYGPKDDDKHRNYWRDLYTAEEAGHLKQLISQAKEHKVNFVYALSPGLDIKFSREEEILALQGKLGQLHDLGCRHFAVFFDDIEEKMNSDDSEMFQGNFAKAQVHVANKAFSWLNAKDSSAKLLFCPTEYCGMMAKPSISESNYLKTLGDELDPKIIVMWTGPDIISREITVQHVKELSTVLKRKPFIWDNYFANDYDIRRIYLGPLEGRPQELISMLSGLMLNPNCEYAANFVPTIALSRWRDTSKSYNAEDAAAVAASQWLPHFEPKPTSALATIPPITLEDVQRLIDCFYLPYQHGKSALSYKKQFESLLSALANPKSSGLNSADDPRIKAFAAETNKITTLFSKLTYIKNRDLLYSLYSYMWELKEEAYLLVAFVQHLATQGGTVPFFERFHKASTFRGGFVADLQRLYSWDPQVGSVSLPASSSGASMAEQNTFKIAPYEPKYEAGVYRVCLRTGDSGADGTHLFPEDPMILGHRYIGPYVHMEPDLCFVLLNTSKPETDPDYVCGYVAGAFDTTKFYRRMMEDWFPKLRALYPNPPSNVEERSKWTPTQNLMFDFHNPALYFPESLKYFHAHMHIDLVAEAQGKGLGTVLIEKLLDALQRKGAKALHLGMSSVNHRAYKFYRKVGFVELAHVDDDAKEISPTDPREHTLIMGKTL